MFVALIKATRKFSLERKMRFISSKSLPVLDKVLKSSQRACRFHSGIVSNMPIKVRLLFISQNTAITCHFSDNWPFRLGRFDLVISARVVSALGLVANFRMGYESPSLAENWQYTDILPSLYFHLLPPYPPTLQIF